MSTENDLTQLLKGSIPHDEIQPTDPAPIKRKAAARRARRRGGLVLTGLAVAGVGIAASALLGGPTTSSQIATDQVSASPSSTALPHMRPGCPPPFVKITGEPAAGVYELTTEVGAEAEIRAIVPGNAGSRFLEGSLILAKPGTTVGRYITDPDVPTLPPLPATDVSRAENQVQRLPLTVGNPAVLRFSPPATGDYPVYYYVNYQGQGDCAEGLANEPSSGYVLVATIRAK